MNITMIILLFLFCSLQLVSAFRCVIFYLENNNIDFKKIIRHCSKETQFGSGLLLSLITIGGYLFIIIYATVITNI